MGGLPADKTVYAVASHPRKAHVIFAALREGIYRGQHGRTAWTRLDGGPSGVVALAIHPEQPEVIYAATWEGAVYLSEDGGRIWRETGTAANTGPGEHENR